MIRLIAFDLDGTFLDDSKKIPEENLRALESAAKAGIHIVPATGRMFCGLPKEIAALPFIRYFILINGAQVYDSLEDRIVSSAEISKETALKLYDYAEHFDCLYDSYIDDRGYMNRDMYDRLEDYVDNKPYVAYMRTVRTPVDSLKDYVRNREGTIQKVQYFFKDQKEKERQRALIPTLFPDLVASSSLGTNIEINSAKAGKGPALEALCTALDFTAGEALAFGDGLNDLDMIKTAGYGTAMANSDPAVLAVARNLTEFDNNHAGVAKEIRRLLPDLEF